MININLHLLWLRLRKLSCDHVDTQSILLCKSMKSEGEVMVL